MSQNKYADIRIKKPYSIIECGSMKSMTIDKIEGPEKKQGINLLPLIDHAYLWKIDISTSAGSVG